MYDLDPVDHAFLDTAEHRFAYPIRVPAPADMVWAELTGPRPLAWCRMLTHADYTSAPAHGVGTTRRTKVAWGAMSFDERFFAWDDSQRRHSFYVERCNLPLVRAFAEDYHVEATATGSLLTWTFAFEADARHRGLLRAALPGIRLLLDSLARDTSRAFGGPRRWRVERVDARA